MMVNVHCAVQGCPMNSRQNKDVSYHRIVSDRRHKSWLNFCQRPDLIGKTRSQLRNQYICSIHFEPWMFKNRGNKQTLFASAIPTVNPPLLRADEANGTEESGGTGDVEAGAFEQIDVVPVCEENAVEIKEEFVAVKQEIDIVEEENLEEQLERRKRQNECVPAIEVKRVRLEPKIVATTSLHPSSLMVPVPTTSLHPSSLMTVPKAKPEKHPTADLPRTKVVIDVGDEEEKCEVTYDFMRSVINAQQEILCILKSQVLLEHTNSELLTFLRLIGVKLSRLGLEERRNMQDEILQLILDKTP